jgi:DNA/RNA endonuclease YhcR with UshA esterase domain
MTRPLLRIVVYSLALLLLMESAAIAHHSFAAEYDANKPVTLKGTITKVEWTNPHIRFYMDVKNAKGQVTNWEISGPSVNALVRNGAKKDSLKSGQSVTVEGFLARHVENLANMKSVKSADGKLLLDRIGGDQQ